MLKPALQYKDKIIEHFTKILYTQDYFYYSGYDCGSELPDIQPRYGEYTYAIVDNDDNVLGYISYQIRDFTDTVCNFGLISFDIGNPIVGRDLFRKMEQLINTHHRIEWYVISGNPVKRHYDNFCKKHNGRILRLRDATKNLNGDYVDSFMYEIINEKQTKNRNEEKFESEDK